MKTQTLLEIGSFGEAAFKITFKQQAILLSHLFFTSLGLGVFMLYGYEHNMSTAVIEFAFCFLFVIDILPTIMVYTQYLMRNYGAELTINMHRRDIEYKDRKQSYKFSFNDIKSLDYYWNYGKGSGKHSFGEFRYYKISLTDGNELFITCLMINHIEYVIEPLLNLTAVKHGNFLNLI